MSPRAPWKVLERWQTQAGGPLLTAFRRHVPSGDLQSAFLATVRDINAELDRQRR